MSYEITVGVVGWIDPAGPWPIRAGNGWMSKFSQMKAGLQDNTNGVVRTYMGLMATTNKAPATTLDFPSYRKTKDFRAMVWAHLRYDEITGGSGVTGVGYVGSEAASKIVDPGFTPPVDTAKVAAMGMLPFWMETQKNHVADRTWYAAEASPLSDIVLGARHPNSVLQGRGRGEAVIANGLIRFRAGPHTNKVGLDDANSQFHVPWVWAEFLLTSIGKGNVRCRGASSMFPTVAWYVNDRQAARPHRQDTDTEFKFDFWTNKIDVNQLHIWPVLKSGAPRSMPEPSLNSDAAFSGSTTPVTSLPYTCPGGGYVTVTSSAVKK